MADILISICIHSA